MRQDINLKDRKVSFSSPCRLSELCVLELVFLKGGVLWS